MGLYSKKYQDWETLKDCFVVALPNKQNKLFSEVATNFFIPRNISPKLVLLRALVMQGRATPAGAVIETGNEVNTNKKSVIDLLCCELNDNLFQYVVSFLTLDSTQKNFLLARSTILFDNEDLTENMNSSLCFPSIAEILEAGKNDDDGPKNIEDVCKMRDNHTGSSVLHLMVCNFIKFDL